MRDYHGCRYLSADMFVSYCRDLKVDLDPFNHDLELYEKERVIFPAARIIQPKEYILERRQFEKIAENIGRRMPKWEKLETLLFGNKDDAWHDFDRAFQMGNNEYIMQPKVSDFHPWESYRVEIENSNGEKYLTENVTHYYHYWQIHQIYGNPPVK